jgi:hypothetical protein
MRHCFLLLGVCLLALAACQTQRKINYAPLDQAGMWSSSVDQLKKLNVTDLEIAQLCKLKQVGASDDLCLALFKAAREHHHDFSNAEAAIQLSQAGYSDDQILEMAKTDQIDVLSVEAISLKLIGLSNPTVQAVIRRRIAGLPVLTSEQIGRLKNTAMSERQILDLVNQGLSDGAAEKLITSREAKRNHSNTGFVRNSGRRSH